MANDSKTQAIDKDKQINVVFNAFFEYPKTMKEVYIETGIVRESICRYKKTLILQNRISLICYRKCKVTNRNVGAYSTNPDCFVKSNQLKLF